MNFIEAEDMLRDLNSGRDIARNPAEGVASAKKSPSGHLSGVVGHGVSNSSDEAKKITKTMDSATNEASLKTSEKVDES